MFHDLRKSVVRILDNKQQYTLGTGFLASPEGLILTCAHIFPEAFMPIGSKVWISFLHESSTVACTILKWIPPHLGDIVCLRVDEDYPSKASPLSLGRSDRSLNHKFRTYGFPKAKPMFGMDETGTIAQKTRMEGATQEEQFELIRLGNTQITHGFSGAPVLDEKTRTVIGMIAYVAPRDDLAGYSRSAFCIPSELIKVMIPALAQETNTVEVLGISFEPIGIEVSPRGLKNAQLFYMAQTVITNLQWARIMGESDDRFASRAKHSLSVSDISSFCEHANLQLEHDYIIKVPQLAQFKFCLDFLQSKHLPTLAESQPNIKSSPPTKHGIYDLAGLVPQVVFSEGRYYQIGGSFLTEIDTMHIPCKLINSTIKNYDLLGFRPILELRSMH
ncbi:MAG: serine protease [Bacteroidota bacterium]